MHSNLKPIKFWESGGHGANPPRVQIIFEELGIPYESIVVPFTDVKNPEFTKINPNGRLPAIHDPNTDLTLWESAAIILYLVEEYDKEHRLSFPAGSKEAHLARQWAFFQASGQGPYYGQLYWFDKFHHEKLPSARERYLKEANRVTGVLEGWLAEQEVAAGSDGPWLVGGKLSYVDLGFLPWQIGIEQAFEGKGFKAGDYPHVKGWMERMMARDSVKMAMSVILAQQAAA